MQIQLMLILLHDLSIATLSTTKTTWNGLRLNQAGN